MKKIILIVIIVWPSFTTSFTQEVEYAKNIIKTLTSEEYAGRGYIDKGEKKAAEFIAEEFQKHSLLFFDNSYFQKFKLPINVIRGKVELTIDNSTLIPGKDFLIDAGSPGIKGNFNIVYIDNEEVLNTEKFKKALHESKGKFLCIDNRDINSLCIDSSKRIITAINLLRFHPKMQLRAGIIILDRSKLSWNLSTHTLPHPYILINTDSCEISRPQKIKIGFKNKFYTSYQTQNITGYIKGTSQPDSFIVFTAHYDHLGKMGDGTIFPGANDNASGIAMLLNLARYYSSHPPDYSIVFVALGAEEAGLLGAKYFVENSPFDLSKVRFLVNFDLAGTGDEGITVVNGSVFKDEFKLLSEINKKENLLPQIKTRGEACNSDHCMFYKKGVPCFYIYTLGGISAYHDINDRYETLPLTEFQDYFTLITLFVNELNKLN